MGLFETVVLRTFLLLSGIVSMLIFSWNLKRRSKFWLRLIAFVALYTGIDYLSQLVSVSLDIIWLHCLFNVATFFILSFFLCFLYKEKILTVLFCGVSAKCIMHVAEYLSKIIFHFTIKSTYLSMAVYIVVYIAAYFLFARRIRGEECVYINRVEQIIFALIALIATDVVILCFNNRGMTEKINIFVFFLITIICLVILFLQYNLFVESKYKIEAAVIGQLREKEREQYEISKETINLIGIRQHDLKSMLVSRNIGLPESELNEIVKSLDGYDLPFKTGNRTLDIILMEEYSVCKNKDIRLECLADGGAMGFLSEMDIYSLFLNALNNSIESANKIEDKDKRIIWLKTYTRGNLLFIQVQNYFSEVLRLANGYQTTKPDKDNHGFGLKSMKLIAEKYGGEMSAKTEGDMFFLGFVIPIP